MSSLFLEVCKRTEKQWKAPGTFHFLKSNGQGRLGFSAVKWAPPSGTEGRVSSSLSLVQGTVSGCSPSSLLARQGMGGREGVLPQVLSGSTAGAVVRILSGVCRQWSSLGPGGEGS